MFQGRKAIIATKHQKEQVIAPIVERELGLICFTDENFDTDVLGTFTGEVEREMDPVSTLREKCLRAMRANHCDLGIASEGSFGPHPSIFFVSADDELLILIDTQNKLEVIVREISTATNFNGRQLHSHRELMDFAEEAGFPQHGLILRKSKEDYQDIYKGITDPEALQRTFEQLRALHGSVYAETDMRAMYNPTRMRVIESAAQKLVQKIQSVCPECKMPGFGVVDTIKGLPCGLCGRPTASTLSFLYVCQHCQCAREEMYPHQKRSEDPMYCDACNP